MDFIDNEMKKLKLKIARKVYNLEREITEFEKRQREDTFMYGFGGSYCRKEQAINRRKQAINALREFENQIVNPVIIDEVVCSVLYCKACNSEVFTQRQILEGWHECPICRKMIYGNIEKKVITLVNKNK